MFSVVPEGAVRQQRQGGFQVPVPRARSSGAMQDGVFERFGVRTAAGTRGIGVFRLPGGVGGKVAPAGTHLMKASCNELVQAHKGVGVEAAGVRVVVGGGVEGVPFTHHEELGANLQGLVGVRHKEGGGDILAGRGWYLQHEGEAGEAFAQWDCKVGKRVDWKMFTHRGGGDWGTPVQWEVV